MSAALVRDPVVPLRLNERDDEDLYEIVNGQRVELPPMSALARQVATDLVTEMGLFTRANKLRRPSGEMLFRMPQGHSRRPDAAYVSFQRWPKGQPIPPVGDDWDVVPELAAEVVSPTDRAEDLLEKVLEYFQAGVLLVWVIYPRFRVVHVYENAKQVRVLNEGDELDGGTVLPGFRLPLTTLFQQ